jgi:hypothetical protein
LRKSSGASIQFELEMSDAQADIKIPVDDPSEWILLKIINERSVICVILKQKPSAAINLNPLVNAYADVNAIEKVRLEVTIPAWGCWQDTNLASALRSMMGLLVVASACPSFFNRQPF